MLFSLACNKSHPSKYEFLLLFILFQMADRLLSTIGQDILDALFWTATEPRGRKREHLGTLPHLLLAIVYVSILRESTYVS